MSKRPYIWKTRHFKSYEFGIEPGDDQQKIDNGFILATILDDARDFVDVPVFPTNYYRSPKKNAGTAYAVSNSTHMRYLSVDITLKKGKVNNNHLLLPLYEFMKRKLLYGGLFLYELPDGTLDSIHYGLPASDRQKACLRYVKTLDGRLIRRADY